MDLVRPLALAAVPCVVVPQPGTARTDYSRFASRSLPWEDCWTHADVMIERLLRFADSQPSAPVLFYQGTSDMLMISRNRTRLRPAFRFVIADASLVEDLTDKARFHALAERLGLPVPVTQRVYPAGDPTGWTLDVRFPVLLKPVVRQFDRWGPIAANAKAITAADRQGLRQLWPRLAAADIDLLAQELIPGSEAKIESYHTYVDDERHVVADFTGRKIRTRPADFGYSTAVTISDAPDVAALGREVVRRLGLVGVAKLDFKRDPHGNLWLLEVNPRFTLWHHPAAVAGLNIPTLVWADLTRQPRPPVNAPRAGVSWCDLWEDAAACRDRGELGLGWALWALRCDAKSGFAWNDPMPFVRGIAAPKLSGHLRKKLAGHVGRRPSALDAGS